MEGSHPAAGGVGFGVARGEAHGFIQVVGGAAVVVLPAASQAADAARPGVVGGEAERLLGVGDRAVELGRIVPVEAEFKIRLPAADEDTGVARGQGEGRRAVGRGLVGAIVPHQQPRPRQQRIRRAGVQPDGLTVLGEGRVLVAAFEGLPSAVGVFRAEGGVAPAHEPEDGEAHDEQDDGEADQSDRAERPLEEAHGLVLSQRAARAQGRRPRLEGCRRCAAGPFPPTPSAPSSPVRTWPRRRPPDRRRRPEALPRRRGTTTRRPGWPC